MAHAKEQEEEEEEEGVAHAKEQQEDGVARAKEGLKKKAVSSRQLQSSRSKEE